MRDPNSDQNGHNRPDGQFSRYEKWQDVPVDVLRQFADVVRLQYTDRGLAEMVEMSPAAVQDFVKGLTQPERRTLRAFGELYLELVPYAVERVTVAEREVLPRLKSVLPEGEEAALEYIDALVRAGKADGTLSHSPEQLGEWLRFLVQAEYQIELPYRQYLRKRRPKGSGGEGEPRRSRKKKPDADPEK
jgi:hypothetical protein